MRILFLLLFLSGCANMTDRQKHVAWFVAGVAVVSLSNGSNSVITKPLSICDPSHPKHHKCNPEIH